MQEGLEHRIPDLAGMIREPQFQPDSLASSDAFFNLRNHPLQTDYIWGSQEFEAKYPGFTITDVLKGICADFQIAANYDTLTPLPFEHRSDYADAIALVPGSAGIVKCWPSFHWIELARKLMSENLKVIIVGQPHRSEIVRDCMEAGLTHVPTPTMVDALDALSNARCVVAGDTGLMHMAVHQNVPTVGIFRYNVMFKRDYPHVRTLTAPVCHQPCLDLEYGAVPNKVISFDSFVENEHKVYWETWECTKENWSDRCMAEIKPVQVKAAIDELTSAALVRG